MILTPQAMTDILETAEIVPHVAKDIERLVLDRTGDSLTAFLSEQKGEW